MRHEATSLVLGRGEVYFDAFAEGTRKGVGERYLGNTTTFRLQRDLSTIARATSYGGRKVNTAPLITSEQHSIEVMCDHVNIDNIALWFGSPAVEVPVDSQTGVREDFVVTRGLFYQLGKSVIPHIGARNLAYLLLTKDGNPLDKEPNYDFDPHTGRFHILPNARDVNNGDTISGYFSVREQQPRLVAPQAKTLSGSLRFLSYNEGVRGRPQNDILFPFVTIKPRGQIDLKGDEFQRWGFTAEAMNLAPNVHQAYVLNSSASVALTPDECTIIDELGNLASFAYWDDRLHVIINKDWPETLGAQKMSELDDDVAIIANGESVANFPSSEGDLDHNVNIDWPNAIQREE